MKLPAKLWISVATALTAVVVGWFCWRGDRDGVVGPVGVATNATAERVPSPPITEPAKRLANAVGALNSSSAEQKRATLAELRQFLANIPRSDAVTYIRHFLDSGADAPCHAFSVGSDGFLKEVSSLRVFLLDELARLDPAAAANYSEKLLASRTSADEWAVGLRNYALGRTDTAARDFLAGKFREMVHYEAWRKDPSVGFLEAFDVAVHVGGTELVPDLAEMLRAKDEQAVAHASYLALDRLVIKQPAQVLKRLQEEPELMEGREVTRANYFARANAGDPQQREVLETYLLDPHRSQAELHAFAGLFPNANLMISHNLITPVETPNGQNLRQQDARALEVVEEWLTDARFEKVRPHVERINARLRQFVNTN